MRKWTECTCKIPVEYKKKEVILEEVFLTLPGCKHVYLGVVDGKILPLNELYVGKKSVSEYTIEEWFRSVLHFQQTGRHDILEDAAGNEYYYNNQSFERIYVAPNFKAHRSSIDKSKY